MKVSKTFIWSVFFIVVVATLGYALSNNDTIDFDLPGFSGQSSMAGYVPASYDQLVFLRFDNGLKSVARQTNNLVDNDTFGSVVDSLEEVIVYQGVDTNNQLPLSLIFFEGNESFSIEQIQAFGLLAGDEGYDYRELADNHWVYGDDTSLEWFNQYNQATVEDEAGWEAFSDALDDGDHNAGFLSKSLVQATGQAGMPNNTLVSQFSSVLDYTYAVSSIRENDPQGEIVLQLVDQTLSGPIETLDPQIIETIGTEPLMYLEAGNLLGLLSISRAELESMLPMALGQRGTQQGIAFDNSDISMLLDALEGNIGIVALPAPMSPMKFSVHLIFNNSDLYPVLEKLSPLLESTVAPMLFGTEAQGLEKNTTATGVEYSLGLAGSDNALMGSGFAMSGMADMPTSLPVFSLNRSENTASLDIFATSPATGEGDSEAVIDHYELTDNTKILFGWDSGLMQESVLGGLGVNNAQGGLGANTSQSLFATGSLQGGLSVHPDDQQVRINFTVK